MCIIVCKPKGAKLPEKSVLKNCFINNDDGAGFSFSKDNRIYLSKGYSRFKPFYKAVHHFIKDDTTAILHFRIASVGEVSGENCHPFVMSQSKTEINKTINCTKTPVFAHNGTLSIKAVNGKSDTRQYARIVGDPLIRDNIFRNKSLCKLISGSIGYSKMAFMNRKGDMKLFGEFEEEDGISFSNHSYKYRSILKTVWEKRDDVWRKNYNKNFVSAYGDDDDYDSYYPIVKKHTEEVKEVEVTPSSKEDNKIILLNGDLERYVVTHTQCEMCGQKKEVYYYPGIDISLCTMCISLYCVGYKEVVNSKTKKKKE